MTHDRAAKGDRDFESWRTAWLNEDGRKYCSKLNPYEVAKATWLAAQRAPEPRYQELREAFEWMKEQSKRKDIGPSRREAFELCWRRLERLAAAEPREGDDKDGLAQLSASDSTGSVGGDAVRVRVPVASVKAVPVADRPAASQGALSEANDLLAEQRLRNQLRDVLLNMLDFSGDSLWMQSPVEVTDRVLDLLTARGVLRRAALAASQPPQELEGRMRELIKEWRARERFAGCEGEASVYPALADELEAALTRGEVGR